MFRSKLLHLPYLVSVLKYRKGQPSPYRLPLIVAGSTMNNKDIDVHVGIDNDTLDIYNYEHYYEREDLYYKQLPENFYSIPNYDIHIPAGECQALMDINFNFNGLDLSEKWVLPLIIKDDPSYNLQPLIHEKISTMLYYG